MSGAVLQGRSQGLGNRQLGQDRVLEKDLGWHLSTPPPLLCPSVCSFDHYPVFLSFSSLSKSPVPVLLTPPVLIPEKIRYCCICNLWIRGLSIYYYYYWLIIIIINYVNSLLSVIEFLR